MNSDLSYLSGALTEIGAVLTTLIPILVAVALAIFIWGLVEYIHESGSDTAKVEGRNKMIWGILSLFVIVSVWGIVALVQTLTGVSSGNNNTMSPPEVL